MNHVSLDDQDESVKQFVLGLTVEGGSVLELGGKAVACVLPAPMNATLTPTPAPPVAHTEKQPVSADGSQTNAPAKLAQPGPLVGNDDDDLNWEELDYDAVPPKP